MIQIRPPFGHASIILNREVFIGYAEVGSETSPSCRWRYLLKRIVCSAGRLNLNWSPSFRRRYCAPACLISSAGLYSSLGTTLILTVSPAATPAPRSISLSMIIKNFFARGTMKLSSKPTPFMVPDTGCPRRPCQMGFAATPHTSDGLKGTSTASSL